MEEIAQVYARSLFEVARDGGKLSDVREQLGQFADALEGDRELQVFFFSPYFATEEKKDGLRKAISGGDDVVVNFLELLIEKHRMPAIFRVKKAFQALYDEENKLLPVEITSAVELDEQTIRSIGDRIGEQTGRKVDVSASVDPEVIGGLVVRVGNTVLDASVRTRIESLRKEVARA
jgi:F-type H+-transporting ATPase subunit delta